MSKELVFYTNPMSRGRIVRWMLEEVGQPYRAEILDYATGMKGPAYLAVNPMGKVPAIRHGDTVVTEGAAICAYLADAFPQAGLAPPLGDRGDYYRWLFFAAGPVEAAVTCRSLGFEPQPEQRRMAGFGCLDDVIDTLEGAVRGRDYVAGDRFSAADVYVGSHIGWGMQFGSIERRPAFEAYWERISARPAAIRAREIDDALMPAQPQPVLA
jgi:glutathione S-transferase